MSGSNGRLPIPDCFVRDAGGREGRVLAHRAEEGRPQVQVEWRPERAREWVSASAILSGYRAGMEVAEIPSSPVRPSLGQGTVVAVRTLGGHEQVLVDFPHRGERRWLPYQNLIRMPALKEQFKRADASQAEAFRLRCLAHAITQWDENTGALSRLDIDPLPHQIHVVHTILSSGSLNWMIADDVGLGKTIEVGMLLSALQQRGKAARVLLVTPAGLVKQWQDELFYKFGLDDFEIYGRDFTIDAPRKWRSHARVIGSLDLLKSDAHVQSLLEAPRWDLVIFDEAHRLGRDVQGTRVVANDRYRLAARLRDHAAGMLLLTATPHQGKPDRFQSLLELMRPERRDLIRALDQNPQILADMIVRNNKADVTDAEGRFIFQGKETHPVRIEMGDAERRFDEALQAYLERGSRAADALISTHRSKWGQAVHFVMLVYRKLAASSIAAIERALFSRRLRLQEGVDEAWGDLPEEEDDDAPCAPEDEERIVTAAREFFDGELAMLDGLLARAAEVRAVDAKRDAFLDQVIRPMLADAPDEKVVIFTEYRGTQDHLCDVLEAQFGLGTVSVIHGSMDHRERADAIRAFEDHGRFLVSTEAGGEGINLQRTCHVMVNYDLPWNPMRLVQRVGRLYRYGQRRKVVVFNLYSPQTLDSHILGILYERLDQVVRDMAPVGDEFRQGLEADIVGDLSAHLDVAQALKEARRNGERRTRGRIEEALVRARRASELEREIFSHVSRYDAQGASEGMRLTPAHVRAFVTGMLSRLGIAHRQMHRGEVLDLVLSADMAKALGRRSVHLQITFDREVAARRDVQMMDTSSRFFTWLLEAARDYAFGGRVASVEGGEAGSLITAWLRWQNEQGDNVREAYVALSVDTAGEAVMNPRWFERWLLAPAVGAAPSSREDVGRIFGLARAALEDHLRRESSADVHPESVELVSAAATRG